MKTILNIMKHDAGRLTSSMVAIITIMGLCIIPCLYAWFNIFSNWAPYDSDATSRILVAVANEDDGSRLLGIDVNVGDSVVEALKANDSIGWRFVDSSEDAIEGVYAGDYYAALVIPRDFTGDVMSFATGSLENPQLLYYENEKKNAIAPKITGKAKTAVQEQVNATFIETIAKYASDAAAVMEASGYNPQTVFADLADKMEILSERLENCEVMLQGAAGLASSAESLISVSDQLIGSAEIAIDEQQDILSELDDATADSNTTMGKEVAEALAKEKSYLDKNLAQMEKDINKASATKEAYDNYMDKEFADQQAQIENMRQSAERMEKYLNDLGFTLLADQFGETKDRLAAIYNSMEQIKNAEDLSDQEKLDQLSRLGKDVQDTRTHIQSIDEMRIESLDDELNKSISDARKALANVQKALASMNTDMSGLSDVLTGYSRALDRLQSSLGSTNTSLGYMKSGVNTLAEIFDRIAGNRDISDVIGVLANDETSVAEYLASPVKMDTEVIYPIENYGSAMAPFYTVLAQWVGALLTAVLIKTGLKKRDDLPEPRLYQHFFGRYGLYLFVGLAQALIVSLGDLLYVGIQCLHPVLFVLQACMNGVVFMMINYALVFALDNIGMGLAVIILVLQVAGSGGTYPVEVLPDIFKTLYPFLPFRYSMDAMRECIGGTYENTYAKCMGMLCVFLVIFAALGMILQKPAKWINRLIAESKAKTEVML